MASQTIPNRQDRIEAHRRRRVVRRGGQPVPFSARSRQKRSGPVHTVNLISRDNGVGLSTDMSLLEQVLIPAGYDVQRVNYNSRSMRSCDLAIFLELFNSGLVKYAGKIVGVFNLEWFAAGWEPYLRRFDQLWAKSTEAVEVYRRLGLKSRYTGFASRDLLNRDVERADGCLHLRGHSNLKNTEAVIEAWIRNPDLPRLTIVSSKPIRAPKYVEVLGRVNHDRLVELMNANQVHLCPSRSEGWGHYITEAMTAEGVVITTDASPMNEHVQPDRGVLVPSTGTRQRWKVVEHEVDPDDLAQAVRGVLELPQEQRTQLGQHARQFVADRSQQFRSTVLALIKEL